MVSVSVSREKHNCFPFPTWRRFCSSRSSVVQFTGFQIFRGRGKHGDSADSGGGNTPTRSPLRKIGFRPPKSDLRPPTSDLCLPRSSLGEGGPFAPERPLTRQGVRTPQEPTVRTSRSVSHLGANATKSTSVNHRMTKRSRRGFDPREIRIFTDLSSPF